MILMEDNLWDRSWIPSCFRSLYAVCFVLGPSSGFFDFALVEGSEGKGSVEMPVRPSCLLLSCEVIKL